jgi:hypothetical protein
MPFTINGFNHKEWSAHNLADYGDFADYVTYCNEGEDAFSGYGEWYYVPDEPLPNGDRVIYFGSYGNDNSPGASSYTYAEIFDGEDQEDLERFKKQVGEWEAQPEWVGTDYEDEDEEEFVNESEDE